MTERLDRLEALAETILLAIQQQQTQIGDLTTQVGDLRESVADTVGMIGSLAQEMHTMQSEIRGLQTENHRILERLEAHCSDGHGAA